MADGFRVQMDGFDDMLAILTAAPEQFAEEAAIKLEDGANAIAEEAKLLAPVNFGFLRNLIVVDPPTNNGLSIGIESKSEISAYLEFGTGTKVSIAIDEDIRAYEATFKTGKEVPGMYARPFFFPAILHQTPKIIEDLKKTLQKVLSKK